MRQFKKIGLILIATATFLGCKKDKPITPEMALTPVYVESGTINDSVFVSNGPFDAAYNAIGMIDSTNCATTTNGYADKTGWVYVFEGGRPPQKALNDSEYDRFKCLTDANWQKDYVYNLKLDAEICTIPTEYKIYLREKGDYQRETAVIYNTNVYRFKNRYIIEDYKGFLNYHEYLRPNEPSGDFFAILNLSKTEYDATFNGRPFSGIITYGGAAGIPFTTLRQTDKITFISNTNQNVKFRLRHVYVRHSTATVREFFEGNRVRKDFERVVTNNGWSAYLNEEMKNYLEPVVDGYDCTSCATKPARIGAFLNSPPLPIISEGY